MTKRSSLKRSLVLSLTSLILCVAMLLGTTFAWFSETITSEINTIKSGNLDVELEYYTDGGWKKVSGATDIFDPNALWEPGYTEVVYLKITNLGSLAIKYNLGINISSETEGTNVEGNKFKLSDYIKFGAQDVTAVDAYADREAAVAAVDATATILSTPYSASGTMEKQNDERIIAVVLYMPTSVGNEANHNGEDLPKIELGVSLFATQMASEEDSFDNTYDEDAAWTGLADTSWYFADPTATEFTISTPEALAGLAALVNGEAVEPSAALESTTAKVQESFKDKTIRLDKDVNLNNLAWNPIGRIGVSSTDFTYAFKGTFDGQGHTIYNLNVSSEGWAGVFGIVYKGNIKGLSVTGVKINSSRMAGAIVGQIYGSIDDCHVENANILMLPNWTGSAYDNGDKVGGIVGWLGDNGNNNHIIGCTAYDVTIKAYRDMGGIAGYIGTTTTVENCKVDLISLTADQITNAYGTKDANANAVVGRVSTPANVQNNTETNVTVNTDNLAVHVKDAAGLKEALANGGNIVLLSDIDLNETVTVPSGIDAVLYMNNKTIAGTTSATGKNGIIFEVPGNLTVSDGVLTTVHTGDDMGWNNCTEVFHLTFNGTLTLNNVTVENLGGTAMAYAIDLTNIYAKDIDSKLTVNNSVIKSTYIPVRVFNNGDGVHSVEINDSTLDGGKYSFWVQYYADGDFSSAEVAVAKRAKLNIDIYNNNNTFIAPSDRVAPILYGFDEYFYFDETGKQVVTAPIEVPIAPLEEDFLFPAGTNAVMYKDMVLSGDAQITHTENAVLGLYNVTANVDHNLIVRKSGGAICISDCDFTLTDGAKLISVGEGGDAYQVFLINVRVNGELLTDANAGQYLEGISWFGAYPEWPET